MEIRASEVADDGSATIEGRAVPYGQTITVGGISETFARGSVDTKSLVGKPILWQHDTSEPIGRIVAASNTDDGADFRAKILPTGRGKDAIMLLRDGSVKGLSIGFRPVTDTWAGDAVTRQKVDVAEVSVATIPAYSGAGVTAVRNQEKEEGTAVETTTPEVPTVDLSGLATREDLTALESRIAALAPAPTGPALSVRDAFTLQLTDAQQHRKVRALADVISSGNAGVLPPQWSNEVRNYVDSQRYAFGALGRIGFPSVGHTLTIPKVLQNTVVTARGAEKSEIPSQAFTTGSDTFTASWYAGGSGISLEVIWQSDPSIFGLIVENILSQYAVVTDAALTLAVETAGTATGEALDFTDWGTVSAQLIANAEVVRAATGQPGDVVMLTTDSWQSLIGLMDAEGRRIFAPVGASNADGSASLLSRSINVGGITCIHNPRSAEDVQTNTKSARVGEKPPVTLTSDNVALMGRDLGVLGAMLFVPAFPAGILTYAAV